MEADMRDCSHRPRNAWGPGKVEARMESPLELLDGVGRRLADPLTLGFWPPEL